MLFSTFHRAGKLQQIMAVEPRGNAALAEMCMRKEVSPMDLVAEGLVALAPIDSLPPPLRQAYQPSVKEPVVQAAETTYYRACVAVYTKAATEMQLRCEGDDAAECRMYRAAKSLKPRP